MRPFAAFQDGKYDRLLRLLYDDIEKYETEVRLILFDSNFQLHTLHCHCACCWESNHHACDMYFSKACVVCECSIDKQIT